MARKQRRTVRPVRPVIIYDPRDGLQAPLPSNQGYQQFFSVDPARKNLGVRIERRYSNGAIIPIYFYKFNAGMDKHKAYVKISSFLDSFLHLIRECHWAIIEKQISKNYSAVRISQHIISYLLEHLKDNQVHTLIIEIDPKIKGRVLGAPQGITYQQLKEWAVYYSRNLLLARGDYFSLQVMDHFSKKQDDLADTIVQVEALCILWNFPRTLYTLKVTPIVNLTIVPRVKLRIQE